MKPYCQDVGAMIYNGDVLELTRTTGKEDVKRRVANA
jgi:hypothetical protein